MFIDGILSLPEELEIKFNEEISKLQGGKKMGLTEEMSCIGEIAYKKGMQQGMQQGMQKGEYHKSLEIAKNMYKKGVNDEVIQEVTGLTREGLRKIKKLH